MTVPVIIAQSGTGESFRIAEQLVALGLEQGQDFVAASHPNDVEWAFSKNERQLLIVGTWHGEEGPTASFVKKAREGNPNLIVWFYSVMPCRYPEVYDKVFDDLNKPGIPKLVRTFLIPSW